MHIHNTYISKIESTTARQRLSPLMTGHSLRRHNTHTQKKKNVE